MNECIFVINIKIKEKATHMNDLIIFLLPNTTYNNIKYLEKDIVKYRFHICAQFQVSSKQTDIKNQKLSNPIRGI